MARTLAPLLAAMLLLCPASLSAQSGDGRMPRGQAATTEVLTIGGTWGFPCALNWRCSAWSEEQWEALEVVAWVGPDRFEGEFLPDSNFFGGFEVTVQVPPARRGELVMVEVLAASPEGHTARFQSLQGTAARLLEEAGPGGRIGNTERRPNNVTVLTTALAGLLEEANAGQWRMTEPRLLALLQEVDPSRLMRHAQVFQGINLGLMPGTGSVDPNALIASTDAVEAYLAGVPGQSLEDAYSSLDSGGATAFQEIDFLGLDKTMVPASAPGTVSFGRRDGVRMRMIDDWSEDGFVGSVMDTGATGRVSAMFLPNIDSYPRSARVVRPGHPSFEFEDIHVDCPGVGPVQALRISARIPSMFRRMALLAGLEFIEFTESRTLAYRLPGDVDPACREALPSGEVRRNYYAAHPAVQLPRGRVRPTLHAGPVALQLLNPDPVLGDEDSQFMAGTVDFSTGRVVAPGYAAQGNVGVSPQGELTLTVEILPDSLREGVVDMRMERVRGDGLGAEEWMLSTRLRHSVDDHLRAHVSPAVRVDPRLVLGPQLLDGRWQSGADVSRPGAVEAFAVDFEGAPGQGVEQVPGGEAIPFSWRIEEGELVAVTFALDSEPEVLRPDCPPGAQGCREVRRRVWEPLRMDARSGVRRLYVIEALWLDTGAGLQRVSRQLNFYDRH